MSPDEDFSAAGAKSGIKYDKSFLKYKEMLTEDPDSRVYKRIIAEFNASIFGTAPVLKNNFVVNDGDYNSEVEQFKRDIRADPPVEDVADVQINTPSHWGQGVNYPVGKGCVFFKNTHQSTHWVTL